MGKLFTMQKSLWLILLLILLSIRPVMGQYTKMVVHKTDGITMVFDITDIKELTFSGITGIENLEKISDVSLILESLKTYPNPVRSATTIEYKLYEPGNVRVCIHNQQGVLIKELFNKEQLAGEHSLLWKTDLDSGKKASPGIYLCTIQFKNQIYSKRIIVIN